jgi:glycosyltransferase involved in cell wall biosynthesis
MIVRDEEKNLPGALASLRGRVDELIVVDTGSRDATVAIAEAASARVLHVPWQDDFSQARNVAIAAAGGRYCLMVDADDVLDAASYPAFRAFLAKDASPKGLVHYISETPDGRVHALVRRVFRNDGSFRYVGRVHEQLVGEGATGDSGLVLLHSGYTAEAVQGRDKIGRNMRLLRAELEERGEDPYVHFQLGRSLFRCGDHGGAAYHYQRALIHVRQSDPYYSVLVVDLGYTLKALKRVPEALAHVDAHQLDLPDCPDLWFLKGILHMEAGHVAAMLTAFETCLSIGDTRRYESVEGVGSYRAHFNLGLFRELQGQRERAEMHYRAALQCRSDFTAARARLAAL